MPRRHAEMPAQGLHYDVAIVGGGLAGLVVAYRLRAERPELRIIVLEAEDRPGGKVRSEQVEHPAGTFLIEAGPDCFLAQKPWGCALVEELGLAPDLIPINAMQPAVSLLRQGRLIELPPGVSLLAPTQLLPFLRSPLISPVGKARMALDVLRRPRASDADESIATFVRRTLGQEALDWIAEPLMAGIYSAGPDELSLLATFPQLSDLERTHGSVIRGLRSVKRSRSAHDPSPAPFLTLRAGMQTLATSLARKIDHALQLGARVTSLRPNASGFDVASEDRPPVHARTVVLAVPAAVAATLVAPIETEAARLLARFRTASTGTISMAFRASALHNGPKGYGLIIPAKEARPFNAMTIASSKFTHRAPHGWVLLRLFFGGARSPETMRLGDDELQQAARAELTTLFGVDEVPSFVSITRWSVGNPVYEVGHLNRVQQIEERLPQNLLLTGSAYRGVGIPDVIRDAEACADRLLELVSRSVEGPVSV